MRIGKVKESILKRSVLRQLHNHSEKGSPAPGEDAGVLFMPEFMPEFTQGFSGKNGVAMAVNPVEGWTFAAKRAVYGAVNSMLAAGAAPKAISLSILMPEEAEEKQLKALIKRNRQPLYAGKYFSAFRAYSGVTVCQHTYFIGYCNGKYYEK